MKQIQDMPMMSGAPSFCSKAYVDLVSPTLLDVTKHFTLDHPLSFFEFEKQCKQKATARDPNTLVCSIYDICGPRPSSTARPEELAVFQKCLEPSLSVELAQKIMKWTVVVGKKLGQARGKDLAIEHIKTFITECTLVYGTLATDPAPEKLEADLCAMIQQQFLELGRGFLSLGDNASRICP
jgi:hypothetical protein